MLHLEDCNSYKHYDCIEQLNYELEISIGSRVNHHT